MTVAQERELRDLILAVTAGDLRRPWFVQTSNSWRRIGTDRGDGDVLCPTIHHRDRQPDLIGAPHVLDYIVAAHPFVVGGLIEQRDRAWHAIDYLRHKIQGHDEAFVAAEAIRSGVQAPSSALEAAYAVASHAMAVQHDTTGEPSCDAEGVPLKTRKPKAGTKEAAACTTLADDEVVAAEALFNEAWLGRGRTGSCSDLAEVLKVARKAIRDLAAERRETARLTKERDDMQRTAFRERLPKDRK